MDSNYLSTDKNHQDETTNTWFDVNGENFAVSRHGDDNRLLDRDGCPVEPCNDRENVLDALLDKHREIGKSWLLS